LRLRNLLAREWRQATWRCGRDCDSRKILEVKACVAEVHAQRDVGPLGAKKAKDNGGKKHAGDDGGGFLRDVGVLRAALRAKEPIENHETAKQNDGDTKNEAPAAALHDVQKTGAALLGGSAEKLDGRGTEALAIVDFFAREATELGTAGFGGEGLLEEKKTHPQTWCGAGKRR
jgi:hypothetical protein